ncbi:hypothetical protein SAMN05660226_03095 [Parapedobacter luteus]|uniref:Uncharacterized protein n=1 Tax=Parapedobacter luteus TaxID=623280 RepID=A0A1T5E1X6_9SPHI|nr:hypothetical protein SAMN05660226_03095 [Parapedobacter luteus]
MSKKNFGFMLFFLTKILFLLLQQQENCDNEQVHASNSNQKGKDI